MSLPDDLIAFADTEAERRGTTRSAFLAELLAAERVRGQLRHYLDRHGWDVGENEGAWREFQQASAARYYADDNW